MTAYDTEFHLLCEQKYEWEREEKNNEYVELLNDVYNVQCTLVQIHSNSPSSNENNKSNRLAVISSLLSIQLNIILHAMDYIVCNCRLCAVVYWWTYAFFHCWFNAVDRQNVYHFCGRRYSNHFFLCTFPSPALTVELVLWWPKKITITELMTVLITLKNCMHRKLYLWIGTRYCFPLLFDT